MGEERVKYVFLTHQQLLEKYPKMVYVFSDEDFLIMLLDAKFIYGYALTPNEIKLGKNYVYKDSDSEVEEEDMTYFYEEQSILTISKFRNGVIKNLIDFTK
jgi:hypothetical protein